MDNDKGWRKYTNLINFTLPSRSVNQGELIKKGNNIDTFTAETLKYNSRKNSEWAAPRRSLLPKLLDNYFSNSVWMKYPSESERKMSSRCQSIDSRNKYTPQEVYHELNKKFDAKKPFLVKERGSSVDSYDYRKYQSSSCSDIKPLSPNKKTDKIVQSTKTGVFKENMKSKSNAKQNASSSFQLQTCDSKLSKNSLDRTQMISKKKQHMIDELKRTGWCRNKMPVGQDGDYAKNNECDYEQIILNLSEKERKELLDEPFQYEPYERPKRPACIPKLFDEYDVDVGPIFHSPRKDSQHDTGSKKPRGHSRKIARGTKIAQRKKTQNLQVSDDKMMMMNSVSNLVPEFHDENEEEFHKVNEYQSSKYQDYMGNDEALYEYDEEDETEYYAQTDVGCDLNKMEEFASHHSDVKYDSTKYEEETDESDTEYYDAEEDWDADDEEETACEKKNCSAMAANEKAIEKLEAALKQYNGQCDRLERQFREMRQRVEYMKKKYHVDGTLSARDSNDLHQINSMDTCDIALTSFEKDENNNNGCSSTKHFNHILEDQSLSKSSQLATLMYFLKRKEAEISERIRDCRDHIKHVKQAACGLKQFGS